MAGPPPAMTKSSRRKAKRTGRKTGPMRFRKGRLIFKSAAGLLNRRLGLFPRVSNKVSEPIQDLVGPEPLEPVQRLVQGREFLVGDAADLLHGLDVLLIERVDDTADFLALRGEADAHRAAIDPRALVIEEAELDQLLQIVGDVGAEVIAARTQLTRGQLLVADVVEQQC